MSDTISDSVKAFLSDLRDVCKKHGTVIDTKCNQLVGAGDEFSDLFVCAKWASLTYSDEDGAERDFTISWENEGKTTTTYRPS